MNIRVDCESCGATGLYRGFAEPEGTAVVCLTCNGEGFRDVTYKTFTGRKERRGIKTVRKSRGTFIALGVGAHGSSITYAEFKQGKRP